MTFEKSYVIFLAFALKIISNKISSVSWNISGKKESLGLTG